MDDDRDSRIRQKAYEIWEREGCPEGRDQEHWDMASELVAQEEGHRSTLRSNPSHGRDDVATREQPVEPHIAVESLGDVPGLTDQGERQETPAASREEANDLNRTDGRPLETTARRRR